jgi:hypothetical protein
VFKNVSDLPKSVLNDIDGIHGHLIEKRSSYILFGLETILKNPYLFS